MLQTQIYFKFCFREHFICIKLRKYDLCRLISTHTIENIMTPPSSKRLIILRSLEGECELKGEPFVSSRDFREDLEYKIFLTGAFFNICFSFLHMIFFLRFSFVKITFTFLVLVYSNGRRSDVYLLMFVTLMCAVRGEGSEGIGRIGENTRSAHRAELWNAD